ncbi:MAG: ribosome-associated translation inhibitor RaiA [Patescibacteria group bacterium]|nr:ribosome-associated translation inhibitor RaiA [Patescibacteria group bacterium]
MRINIKAAGISLTPSIKNYVQDKMDMLEKYLYKINIINVDFEVEMTTRHHVKGEIFRAEANVSLPGKILRVEKTEKNLYKAIDKVKDHLARSIKRYKDKRITQARLSAK